MNSEVYERSKKLVVGYLLRAPRGLTCAQLASYVGVSTTLIEHILYTFVYENRAYRKVSGAFCAGRPSLSSPERLMSVLFLGSQPIEKACRAMGMTECALREMVDREPAFRLVQTEEGATVFGPLQNMHVCGALMQKAMSIDELMEHFGAGQRDVQRCLQALAMDKTIIFDGKEQKWRMGNGEDTSMGHPGLALIGTPPQSPLPRAEVY